MSDHTYTADGRLVRVVGIAHGDKVVVEYGREASDGELWFSGELATVDRVFDVPPTDALHDSIRGLEKRESDLRARLHELAIQAAEADRAHKDRMSKLKRYDQLRLVEDFIDGKITHYILVEDYYCEGTRIRISTPQDEVCGDDRSSYEKKLKLLALYGDQKSRSPEWRLHYYSDGSDGRSQLVYPFTSLEAAREMAVGLLEKAFGVVRDKRRYVDDVISSAHALQVPVPSDIAEMFRATQLKAAQSRAEEARTKLAEAETALARLTAAERQQQ